MKARHLTLILAAAIAVTSCSQKKDTGDDATPAQQLKERLAATASEGKVLFGHHDDPVYGHTWRGDEGRSDVLETAGEYPAVMSWDLGAMESDSVNNLDGVPFDRMRAEVKAQDARGGINTFSWHLWDPVTHLDSWQTADSMVVSRMVNTPEGIAAYNAALDKLAAFFQSLTRDDGSRIGVIFRPWHEHTGSWFWWGRDNCSVDDYRKLWTIMRDNFDRHGIDNIVWAYSPDRCETAEKYMERYPGDDYVDILGADVYHFGGEEGTEEYIRDAESTIATAVAEAAARGKTAAFTETGCESIVIPDWYTRVLLPLIGKYPVAYVTVWRNAHNNEKHFYAPYPGHPAQDDFKKFHDNPTTVFVK